MQPTQQKFSIVYVILAFVGLLLMQALLFGPHTETLSYRDFKTLLKADKVEDLGIGERTITGRLKMEGLEGLLPKEKIEELQRFGKGEHRFITVKVEDPALISEGDDPEGWAILEQVNAASAQDQDIYVFTNVTGVGNVDVNAFQRVADVVIQKSLKEGFGLVASEALWKGRPLVAGNAGGIPMQIPPGYELYLVHDIPGCAARIRELLDAPEAGETYGQAGREHVRARFLLPRLVRDHVALIKTLV